MPQLEDAPVFHEEEATTDEAIDTASSTASCSSDDEAYPKNKKYQSLKKSTTTSPKSTQIKEATFESIARKDQHEKFLKDALDILLKDAVFGASSRDAKVLEWTNPEDMQRMFDFNLRKTGATHEELLKLIKSTIQHSVKTAHPYFVNQLFSSLDPYGLVGQWLTDALNPSVYTYEVSPVFSLMEEVVLQEMRTIVGFPNGDGDGIFCPGGSIANGYAISCARYKFMPDIKKTGLHGLPRLVLFTSEDAHYSVKKLASFLGLGTDNVYLIKTDHRGKMCMNHLRAEIERAVAENGKPFMVSATAGTTVLGAFDPIDKMADICKEYGMWLHVDAAWGGGALMSPKYKHLMAGIERADSVTWNPHKLLAAPQQCSTLLLRHKKLLSDAHSSNASYLFQKDKFYDTTFDTGDKHIQCGRRADVLKFWFMWKAKGTDGLRQHIEKVFDNAEFFTKTIENCPGFKMVLPEPECTNISFWYVPPSLRHLAKQNDAEFQAKIHKIAPKIKERMMKEGTMMVTYQPLKNLPNFFRIVFQNSGLTHQDMLHLVSEFERLGEDL